MIVSKTPYRMSFFGGGTDYPQWYEKEGGAVLSTTIGRYCYLTCRYLSPTFSESRHRIVWSHIENVSTITEILHPAVREGLRWLGFDDTVGIEIHHQSDLRARAGIGSSSAFCVGLINALTALQGRTLSQHEIALMAIELEQVVLKENVGSQDQMAVAYGGLNTIRFESDGTIVVEPVSASEERKRELASRLLLTYAGSSRLASEVAASVIANLPSRTSALRQMQSMVAQARSILESSGSLDDFGRLLHESWMLKRGLSSAVSGPQIDQIYETGLKHGALGGKLLGAGGTGFMVFYVPPERRRSVSNALAHWPYVPVEFESHGTRLTHDTEAFEPSSPSR